MPSTNQCIGSHYDELKQRVFYFNYNSSGYNGIYVYDVLTNAISPLLISYVDSSEDLFNFDPKYPIASVNILYRTEEDGDILHWTDRLNRPMKLNIKDATITGKTYGTDWKKSYLTVARPMPLMSPVCRYVDDINTPINSLKNKLYQFKYRWVYKDNTKSTWGPWSKLFSPANADALSDDSISNINNRIDISVNTGSADCTHIEIGARHQIEEAFTDTMLIATISKNQLSIPSNNIYTYSFYNNNAYEFVDVEGDTLLFDYCPKTANAQELINGNIIAYGGIKEGNTFDRVLDLSSSVSTADNTAALSLAMTKTPASYDTGNPSDKKRPALIFTFSGGLNGLVKIVIDVNSQGITGSPYEAQFVYTYTSGDTISSIVDYFYEDMNSSYFGCIKDSDVNNQVPPNSVMIYPIDEAISISGSFEIFLSSFNITDISTAVFKHNSRYSFGLCYFDEFGVTNGVMTNENMSIITPETNISDNLGEEHLLIPKITFSVNHQPPSWAKYFSFVKTDNLTISDLTTIVCSNTIKGTGEGAGYVYFNINAYQKNTSKFPVYQFAKGDRVRIIGLKGGATSSGIVKDCSVIDLVLGGITMPWKKVDDTDEYFIKVPYNSTFMTNYGNTGFKSFYLEIYTPEYYKNSDTKLYYEFGETFQVGKDVNNNLIHEGHSQNQIFGSTSAIAAPTTNMTVALEPQAGNLGVGAYSYKVAFVKGTATSNPGEAVSVTTVSGSRRVNISNIPLGPTGTTARKIYRTAVGSNTYKLLTTISNNTATTYQDNIADSALGASIVQPAIFTFIRGDYYQKKRIEPIDGSPLFIIDKSVSDKFDSTVKNRGRAFVIDPFAKEIYFPSTIRYSLEYQQNTNINNTNRFNTSNIDDYDRQRGDIQRFVTRGNQLRVFQSRGCGMVPIYQNVMQTADGTDVVSQNEGVLNRIQYYQGEYGIGNQYCSLASSASADYFTDPIVGAQIRLSADGITSLTETFKAHYYFADKFTKYQKNVSDKFGNGGYAKILGVYDVFEEQFTTCMQGSSDSGNPITDMTFSFYEPKNYYTSFYDYYPEWICNAGNLIITWRNGELWTHNNTSSYANFYGTQYSPSIRVVFNEQQNIKKHYNTLTTLGNTTWVSPTQGDIKTNLGQQSKLVQADFRIKDDKYHAALKRDMLSPGGLLNGNVLKGSWLELNLTPINPQNLVDLYYIDLSILQPLNNR